MKSGADRAIEKALSYSFLDEKAPKKTLKEREKRKQKRVRRTVMAFLLLIVKGPQKALKNSTGSLYSGRSIKAFGFVSQSWIMCRFRWTLGTACQIFLTIESYRRA
ncbi:hypothetical protein AVEN_265475-1 [Araneus ventricosus]|uniref:Uncharacterized protein n=1 Tax=Araneus ventricosus TaxID=182803 RepID=A0A4Y2CHR2_ARAVE|nr:hypothetical protein AVEN_265475-1 [Araneus ventricosus]